jgi:hypothetical protein
MVQLLPVIAQMVKVIPSVFNAFQKYHETDGKKNDFILSFDYYSVGAIALESI